MKRVLSFLLVMVMTVTVMLLVVPPIEVEAATTYEFLFPVNNGGVKIAFFYNGSTTYGDKHRGIDIYADTDQIIYAAFSGTVTWIANSCPCISAPALGTNCSHTESWGNCIQIKSDDGKFYGIYGHLKQDSMLVSKGQKVEKGQPLASMGSSGHSWEKHLHFEVRTNPSDRYTSINVNPTNASQSPGVVNYSTSEYKYIQSDTIVTGIYKFNNDGYRMFTVSDKAKTGTLKTSSSSIDSSFEFRIEKDGNYYKIFPKSGTTNCFNVWWSALGDGGTTATNFAISGDEVTLFTKANNDYSQKWIFEKHGDGYLIHPACTPGFSITREDNKLVVKKTTRAANQIWKLEGDCDHNYQYKSNSSNHWKECTLCGDKQSTSSHTYSTNCDTSCNVCGATRTITHTYGSTYSYNSVDHWKTCTVCGHYEYITEHSYSNSCDTTCNTCGYIRSVTHYYKSSYQYDTDTHWKACAVCGNKENIAAHTYQNKDNASGHCKECTVCGKIELISEHTPKTEYTYSLRFHWIQCSICDGMMQDAEEHIYTDSCDATCNTCGYTREAEHIYSNEKDKSCNICGETRIVENKPNTKPNTNNIQTDDEDEEYNNSGMDTATIIIVAGTVGFLGLACVTAVWGKKNNNSKNN